MRSAIMGIFALERHEHEHKYLMNMTSIASSSVSSMYQPPRDELLKQARHAAEASGVHRSEICRRATTSPTKQKWDGLLAFGLV